MKATADRKPIQANDFAPYWKEWAAIMRENIRGEMMPHPQWWLELTFPAKWKPTRRTQTRPAYPHTQGPG